MAFDRGTGVSITGGDQLRTNLNKLAEYVGGPAAAAVREEQLAAGEDMAAMMRRLAPVRTGKLVAEIQVSQDEGGVYVTSGAEYSIFVEFGTVNMIARPFFRPAYHAYGVFPRVADRLSRDIQELFT